MTIYCISVSEDEQPLMFSSDEKRQDYIDKNLTVEDILETYEIEID